MPKRLDLRQVTLPLACFLLAACSGTTHNSSGGGSGGGAQSSAGADTGVAGAAGTSAVDKFSFFLTSLSALRDLSGSTQGFGGDLRYGETGVGAGLRGADKICTAIAERSMPGNAKTWRAFLSATQGEDGQPVNAADRVGDGPWYDRVGRLLAQNKADLLGDRPTGADAAIADDLPNEDGVPNHAPDAAGEVDNHDTLTGTNEMGQLFSTDAGFTCNDWTTTEGEAGTPHCGHSWPRTGGPGGGGITGLGGGPPGGGGVPPGGGGAPPGGMSGPGSLVGSGTNWMSALNEAGCAPGAFVVEAGGPGANGTKSVGDGGGYGGFYCFALSP